MLNMIGFINYIRHDLEGIYTAEFLRGGLSMLFAVIADSFFDLNGANAYILIIGLYGLRSLSGKNFIIRFANIIVSLMLLSLTLVIALYFGHHKLYIPELLLVSSLSAGTVYALKHIKDFSGTIMFMSIFAVVNYGMGAIDSTGEVNTIKLLKASLIGSICVILAVIIVPFTHFHWCTVINLCFYHDLRSYAEIMCRNASYYEFSNLKNHTKNDLLMLQSFLFNITQYVDDKERKQHYLSVINGLVLITCWPIAETNPEQS